MGFQLTLGLKLNAKKTLENFLGAQNQGLVDYLIDKIDARKSAFAFISGEKFSGKSHLLQASCHRLVYQGLQAGYLDLNHVDDLNILNGLDQLSLICFDNWSLDTVTSENRKKINLFIEKALTQKHMVILGSDQKPAVENFDSLDLPELFSISKLSLNEMPNALSMKLEERGLCLPESIQKLILKQSGQCVKSMIDILDLLENSQDSEKKKISPAHLKRLLALAF